MEIEKFYDIAKNGFINMGIEILKIIVIIGGICIGIAILKSIITRQIKRKKERNKNK
ncbi:MAG: hypothetical protein RR449_01515 [Christensenella sp.]